MLLCYDPSNSTPSNFQENLFKDMDVQICDCADIFNMIALTFYFHAPPSNGHVTGFETSGLNLYRCTRNFIIDAKL